MYWTLCHGGYVNLEGASSITVEHNTYGKTFVVARFSSNPKEEGITLMDFTDDSKAYQFLEDLMKEIEKYEEIKKKD